MSPKDGSVKCVTALLDLLSVVSLDSIDNTLLNREVERCTLELRNSRDSVPEEPQTLDRHVEKLVRQLKDVIRDAPERDAEYQLHVKQEDPLPGEMRDRGFEDTPRARDDHDAYDRRQQLEREYSSTSYPKIGPGYSDSISVVSDLTTPTCMPGQVVEEDEHYNLPPMQIDFSRRTPKPQLRRPSLENKDSNIKQQDVRMTTSPLRPPSQREVIKPGGAAASRRQNHQMTMAHLKATGGIRGTTQSHPDDARPAGALSTPPNDFMSYTDNSRSHSDDFDFSASRRESGRRSLLRKSSKYAAAVSATASQRMLLARQESAKERKQRMSRRSPVDDNKGSPRSYVSGNDGFGFSDMKEKDTKKTPDPVLIDDLGFIVGAANSQDPFASVPFSADFPSHDFTTTVTNSFFPAPLKDTKKKKTGSNRRASTGTIGSSSKTLKKKDERIDSVERSTRKKVEMLRRESEGHGDLAF